MCVVGTSPECRDAVGENTLLAGSLSSCTSLCVVFPSSGLLVNTVETCSYKKQLPGVPGEITF